MSPALIGFWLSAMMSLPFSPPASDVHLLVESQFNYLSSVRTTTVETWSSQGKTATKLGDRLTIRREDLGVRWRVDLKAGTYIEDKLPPTAPAPDPRKEDIHTAGYDYEPEFDWTTRETGEKSAIAGQPCRQFVANGDADYAESTVKFWVCEPITGVTYAMNDAVLGMMRSDDARKMVVQTATKLGRGWVLGVEETQQPPIAPTLVMTISVKTIEATPLPATTFELPPNVKKAGR